MNRFGALLPAMIGLLQSPVWPQAPAGLAAAALRHPDFHWERQTTATLRLYYQVDSFAAGRIDSLAAGAEEARRLDLAYLGVKDYQMPIDLFYLDSRAQMQSLVGRQATGFADRAGRAVFLVVNPTWRAFDRHELMHVLSAQLWGPAAEPADWLVEGLATFADGRCGGYPLDTLVAARAQAGALVPLDTLVARFRELYDMTAYLQAASIVGHLYRTQGREAVRKLWVQGIAMAPAILGRSLATLEREWSASLAVATPGPPAETVARIWSKGCG